MGNIVFATVNSFVGLPPVKQLFKYYEFKNDIYSIQCLFEGYEDFFASERVRQDVISSFGIYKSFNDLNKIEKFNRYLGLTYFLILRLFSLRKQSAVVFTTDIFTLFLCLLLKNRKHKLVYLQYEIVEVNLLNGLDQFLFKIVKNHSRKIDVIITPEHNRTEYLQTLLPQSKVESFLTIPNTNNNKVNLSFSCKTERLIISHIGAVGLNHHINNFLRAISELDQEHYEIRFIGSLTKEVVELIKQYKFNCVKIIGQVKHSELHQFYLETDIGIILYKDVSLNHRFCAPNKLYEYWSYGIPVIGDNLPGLRSVFKDKRQGEIIEMSDFNNIKSAIENLRCNVEEKIKTQKYFMDNLKLDNYLSQLDQKLVEN